MKEAIHSSIYQKEISAKNVSTRSHYPPCTGKSHYYSCHSHQPPGPLSPERHQHPYSIDNYSQKINLLLEMKEKVDGISSELNTQYKKISRLGEGSIRRVISLQKGEPWVRSITVNSAADIVAFFQTSLKETQAWHDRALTLVTDFLRTPGTVTRLVVLLSAVISQSDDDKWAELRDLVATYPWYKVVRVSSSDGTRSDWDQSPYDDASYYVEHEPLPNRIARAIPLAPLWLRGVLTRLYQPIFRPQPSDLYRNHDAFAKTNAALACLVMMSDRLYENYMIDFPAHTLEWDMAGSMRVVPDAALVLEGEEALSIDARRRRGIDVRRRRGIGVRRRRNQVLLPRFWRRQMAIVVISQRMEGSVGLHGKVRVQGLGFAKPLVST